MFEKFTEKARRTVFFARYEASVAGSPVIETHHLLLGLLRENKQTFQRLSNHEWYETDIRELISASTPAGQRTSTSVDLPLSEECKRILTFSAEEAEGLGHRFIGTEHIILGVLREEGCFAARILRDQGLDLETSRSSIAESEKESPKSGGLGTGRTHEARVRADLVGIPIVFTCNSEGLLVHNAMPMIPRIGEAIRLHHPGKPPLTYRVQDVIWDLDLTGGSPIAKQVEVRVVPEDSN